MNPNQPFTIVSTPISSLEALAYSSLSDEEFIERISDLVWYRPRADRYTEVGVSRAKINVVMGKFGNHYSGSSRKEIISKIFARATLKLDEQCKIWAQEIHEMLRGKRPIVSYRSNIRRSGFDYWLSNRGIPLQNGVRASQQDIRRFVSELIPCGIHKIVVDLVINKERRSS